MTQRKTSGPSMRSRAWRFANALQEGRARMPGPAPVAPAPRPKPEPRPESKRRSESKRCPERGPKLSQPRRPVISAPANDAGEATRLSRAVLGDPERSSERDRRAMLELILRTDPLVMDILRRARALALPDWRLVSGAIYQSVWNALTGRPSGHGIKDADLVYFDASDLSFEAEDRVIRAVAPTFNGLGLPVEVRNQARVHLWFPERFGASYPKLSCTEESLLNYASRTHAVAVRLEADGRLDVVAPFGLADVFAMRIVPNPALDNAETHAEKARRMRDLWPEVEVVDWPRDARAAPASDATPQTPSAPSPSSRDWMRLSTRPRSELPQ